MFKYVKYWISQYHWDGSGDLYDDDVCIDNDDGDDDCNDDDNGTGDDDDDDGNFLWQRQKSDPRGPLWSATGGERVPGSYKEALA